MSSSSPSPSLPPITFSSLDLLLSVAVYMKEGDLESLHQKWKVKTTDLEWKDVINAISDFIKSHEGDEVRSRVKKLVKRSFCIEDFYYDLVSLTPTKDRTGKTTISIPHLAEPRYLDPNTVFPEFLDEDTKKLLLNLPFKQGSDLNEKDVSLSLIQFKDVFGFNIETFHTTFNKIQNLDDLLNGIGMMVIGDAKKRLDKVKDGQTFSSPSPSPSPSSSSSSSSSSPSSSSTTLLFPDYFTEITKMHIQHLFQQKKESSLVWNAVLLALYDLGKLTGNNDKVVSELANESETIEEFYKKVILHTPISSRTTNLSFTPFYPYTNIKEFQLDSSVKYPEFFTTDTRKLLRMLYLHEKTELEWEDLLEVIETYRKSKNEKVDTYFYNVLMKSLNIDEFCKHIIVHTPMFQHVGFYESFSSSSSSSSSSSTPGKKLNPHLAFPSYYRDSTKLLIQHLFEKNESGLKWENILLALYDLGKATGSNDILAGKLANESKNIEKFYKKVIICTPVSARNTDLFSTPFNPYSNLSTFFPISDYTNYPFPESFTEETKKLLCYLHCYHNPILLSFETVMSAVRDSKREDAYINALLKNCLTMDEFYDWIRSHYSQGK